MNNNLINKVVLEQVAKDYILVDQFFKGWKEGQAADTVGTIEGKRLDEVATALHEQGFSVRILPSGKKAIALRGQITRVDFFCNDGTWTVEKFPFGWTAGTPALTSEQKGQDFDLDAALKWLKDHGWKTIQWPRGARAFKGEMLPIRDRDTILAMRRNANIQRDAAKFHFDLAYYF